MTTFHIYVDKKKEFCYTSGKVVVTVTGPKEIIFKDKSTGFKCFVHSFIGRFTEKNTNTLILYNTYVMPGCKYIRYLISRISNVSFYGIVYVYFYDKDPRPLLVCYKDTAYRPRDKITYLYWWVKAPDIKNCLCEGTVEHQNETLLKALTEVVGFLNQVNLYNHPTGTNGKGCTTGSSVPGAPNACKATENNNANTCTYDVHEYEGKKVMVKVKCADVTPTPPGNKCYKKLTHVPLGTSAEGAKAESGFRLGNIVYNNVSEKGRIDYYTSSTSNGPDSTTTNRSNHWRQPLTRVTAYFYEEDNCYNDPLLVALEFKKTVTGKAYEYYKLNASGTSSLNWTKDPDAGSKIGDNDAGVVKYLDNLRHSIKYVVQINISSTIVYQLRGRAASAGNVFGPIPGAVNKTITVEACETTCTQLASNNYKCYQHKLTGLGEDLYKIGGLKFTVPGQKGQGDIEIPLHGDEGTKIPQIQYNKCMGDVYVYFYDRGGGIVDKVPLMLFFDGKWYIPENRDNYFKKWDQVTELAKVSKPCGDGKPEQLVKQLDMVNRALNRIDLDKSNMVKSGTGQSGYGLPENGGSITVDRLKFPTMRVSLTRQQGPSQPPGKHAYVKIVHRTVNGFEIGTITYKNQDILEKGITPNGTGGSESIKVKNGDKTNGNQTHKQLAETHNCNTVVAYYSASDSQKKLPQLIVILKTDGPIDNGGTVTGTTNTPYGYYILTNKNGGKEYEYKWFKVENKQVTLDDPTDFRLLNSVVILLDQRYKNGGPENYGDDKIKPAIASAKLSSPGVKGDINRITGKTITVRDATTESTCLSKTGFKVFTHDISQLVKLDGSSLKGKLSGISLIAGLRFLIPTRDRKDHYKQITLYDENQGKPSKFVNVFKYHQNGKDEICVFFYEKDPRPLLLFYGGRAYIPIDTITYFRRWYRDETISNCECKGSGSDCSEFLEALFDVSNFFNRLDIKIIPTNGEGTTYEVHKFNGKEIKIKVESKEASDTFCYHRYTHTHCGTSDCKNGCEGFRLGNIYYGCNCIKLKDNGGKNGTCITSQLVNESPPNNYKSADKVVVFYYKHDYEHKFPMVVAMGKTDKDGTTKCKLYYVLVDKGGKIYEKKEENLDLDDNEKLGDKLDEVLFSNNNKLQIIIDQRPAIKLYCPSKESEKNCPPDVCNNCDNLDTAEKALSKFRCDIIKKLNEKAKANKPGCVLLSAGKSVCYEAQLYQTSEDTPRNGATPKATTKTEVKVAPVKCQELSRHGYRCYEHEITGVTDVEQIGGLRFYLWDNTNKGSGGGSEPGCSTSGVSAGSANCPSNTSGGTECKELCLYRPSSGGSPEGTQGSCSAPTVSPEPAQASCTPAQNGQPTSTLPYTTCKGNVYVYFYGDDPLPLLLS